MWQHKDWTFQKRVADSPLTSYARFFNSVEGNTTFYAVPPVSTWQKWRDSVPEGFEFSFKLPKPVTHLGNWQSCTEYDQFFEGLSVLQQVGPIQIQLPARFGPNSMDRLHQFIDQLPKDYDYSVEVRHTGFFLKDAQEKAFNQLLLSYEVNRTLFDTRPLFNMRQDTLSILDAKGKKPRVPCHVISTGSAPVIRYIGYSNLADNQVWLEPWVSKIRQWLKMGKDVYFFLHTPDNIRSPWLALDVAKWIEDASVTSASAFLSGSRVLDTHSQSDLFG